MSAKTIDMLFTDLKKDIKETIMVLEPQGGKEWHKEIYEGGTEMLAEIGESSSVLGVLQDAEKARRPENWNCQG